MKPFLLFLLVFLTLFLSGWTSDDVRTNIEKINVKLSEDEIAVTFLDLTNGESSLIHLPKGEFILVNTGGQGTQKELKAYLDVYGVKKLKGIIITKQNSLFTSNIDWLIQEFSDVQLIYGAHNKQEDGNKKIIYWQKGKEYQLSPFLAAKVIHENQDKQKSLGMDFLLRFGNHQFLFMASANPDLEYQMLENKELPITNILKVAEFGNENGSGEKFVNHVNPQIAIIFHKKGFLPSSDVLERLNNSWIDIYYTRQFGSVTIKCTKTDYEVIPIPLKSDQPKVQQG
ncbi:ComEC/Rec2 family competence protein [Bacillus timonensis]|uniref:ComEC/Rec2 family competence protein n=1 Tax=Bacillus timonensis TaxID=1033734 RepID=UPI000288DE94|nr:hydrolase [Bacillus timonensis]